VKLYRTTLYRGDRIYTQRFCFSRRQWAALKGEMKYLRLDRGELDVIDIPDEMWQRDAVIERNPGGL